MPTNPTPIDRATAARINPIISDDPATTIFTAAGVIDTLAGLIYDHEEIAGGDTGLFYAFRVATAALGFEADRLGTAHRGEEVGHG